MPIEKTAGGENAASTIGTPDDLVKTIKNLMQVSGGVGTIIGFVHDWANPENTRRSWDMVARYVIPEINGYVKGLRESQKFLVENRAVFERAGQAVMAKIMENEKAAAALAAYRPGPRGDPHHQRARPAEGSRQAQGVMACRGRRGLSPSLPATNAKRLRKGAQRRSNPVSFPGKDGLLRFARNDGLAGVTSRNIPARFPTPRSAGTPQSARRRWRDSCCPPASARSAPQTPRRRRGKCRQHSDGACRWRRD